MHPHNVYINDKRLAIFVAVGIITGLFGCAAQPHRDVRVGPDHTKLEQYDLDFLTGDLIKNSRKIQTLKADVDVAIVSPFLREPPQLNFSEGRLAVKKFISGGVPKAAVRLDIIHRREKAVRIIGDGEYYEVAMPVMDLFYTGNYDDELSKVENRIHFTPVEIARVFNVEGLLARRPQILRAYPGRWEFSAGDEAESVELPAQWAIDSIEVESGDRPYPRIHSSLVMDRKNRELTKLDAFRRDGSLMTRAWIKDVRTSRSGDVHIPAEFMIWYPPPLEGTVIRLRLSRVVLNEEIDDAIFEF